MREFGFWVYVGTGLGGCEGYGEADWVALLDDMADARMNSLVICLNRGFRSRLPYLGPEQDPANTVIASGNRLIHHAIEEAHSRGIRVWAQCALNCLPLEGTDIPPPVPTDKPWFKYDLDTPGIWERVIEQSEEIVELFPDADGLSVEFEHHNIFYPHRIPAYDRWAAAHGQPSYEEIAARPLNPRGYPFREIRAYTTWQTCQLLEEIRCAVRKQGFEGDLSTICACNHMPGAYTMEADLDTFARDATDYTAITYDYNRWMNRPASTYYNMVYPRELGIRTHFLARGVMTWGSRGARPGRWMPCSYQDYWRADMEDAVHSGVEGLWMFEADAHTDGWQVEAPVLREKGFKDGIDARRSLLAIAQEVGVASALSRA